MLMTKKSIGIAAACALALGAFSASALATPVNVDGVHWNTASRFDLNVNALNLRETTVSSVGDVLTGYGQIGSINSNNDFCSACDLTFTFNYKVKNITGNQVVFDDGMIQFYVSPDVNGKGTYDEGDPDSAALGTKWLTLTGHKGAKTTFTTDGQLFSDVIGTVGNPSSTVDSSGNGFLDATGGPAMKYVDSHTIADGLGGFADFSIGSSFFTDPASGCGAGSSDLSNVCAYPIQGTGELQGKSVSVPEPGAFGMLGFGLGVLGLFFWRRRKEADVQL